MKILSKNDAIELVIAFIFSIPIWSIFINNWFARVIGFVWAFFGWFLAISYWSEVKQFRITKGG